MCFLTSASMTLRLLLHSQKSFNTQNKANEPKILETKNAWGSFNISRDKPNKNDTIFMGHPVHADAEIVGLLLFSEFLKGFVGFQIIPGCHSQTPRQKLPLF